MKFTHKSALLLCLSMLCVNQIGFSQLIGWDVNGITDFGTSPMAATSIDINLNSGGLERGSGVTTSATAASHAWGGNSWETTDAATAIANNKFIMFSLQPKSGNRLELSSIAFDYRRSSTGPISAILQYKINNGAFINIGDTINFTVTTSSGGSVSAIDLSGASDLQSIDDKMLITFRLVPFGASQVGGTFYIFDKAKNSSPDLALGGTVSVANNLPTLSISNVVKQEGNTGNTIFNFLVKLDKPAPSSGVSFNASTIDGSATIKNIDYNQFIKNNMIIPEGDAELLIPIVVTADTNSENDETFELVLSNVINANAAATPTGTATILDDDTVLPVTKIHDIQGSGNTSALNGDHTIEGIVTQVFAGNSLLNGFYMQEEDAETDADSSTSEGIFIYDPSILFTGNRGDKVRISGSVVEYESGNNSSLTQLKQLTKVTVLSTNNSLPTLTELKLPVASITDFESKEGMLVRISSDNGIIHVTDTYDLFRYGTLLLSVSDSTNLPGSDGRLEQFTQFNLPSVSGNTAHMTAMTFRSIFIDDASSKQNPDPIIFGRNRNPLSATNTIRGGDTLAELIGVLDHRFDGYRIQTKEGLNFQPANPRIDNPTLQGALKVGAFNVLNYFNGDGNGGGFPTERGAETAIEFERQRNKIIRAIVNSKADVLALMEVENDGYGSASAIQDLVNGLNDTLGVDTFAFIDVVESTGTDAIKVAMLYKPVLVEPVNQAKTIPDSFGSGSFDIVRRKPLIQAFKQKNNNEIFNMVAVHFKSKGSLLNGDGNADIGDGQGKNNLIRTKQAVDLTAWLSTDPNASNDTDFLILGDFNSYFMEDPMQHFYVNGYANALDQNSYSYSFDGMWGALDHALGSEKMMPQIVDAKKWHINADEPTALDYNTNFKSPQQLTNYYGLDGFRASDHDVVLVGLNLFSATCVNTLVLEVPVTKSQSARQSITGQIDNKIRETNRVTYSAGNFIELKPGFAVEPGAVFVTELQGCN